MKSAIFALLAGSAAAFAPASVNKVRSIRLNFFRCRSSNDFLPLSNGETEWLEMAHEEQ